jgi:hypothetical protein
MTNLAKKDAVRVNFLRKLTDKNWGASAKTLHTTSLSFVYFTADSLRFGVVELCTCQ